MAVAIKELLTPEIQRPARYLGNELGSVHKPWESAQVRWVLSYPEIYEVGASNLGHIILYNILNAQPRQLCDRTYLPAPDLASKLRATKTPLFAVESSRSLIEFDILGFSLGYELGASNILEMLDLAGIPLTWQERQAQTGTTYPLIFAGGQTATSNPEPYSDFFDFMVMGDGEEVLPEIGLILEEDQQMGLNRQELLWDLAQIPGVYVPQFYDLGADGAIVPQRSDVPKRISRRVALPIPAYSIGLVPYIETVHDRLSIEIRRGCTRGCRFCQPGMLSRPARDVEPERVIEAIEQGIRKTGYQEFSLLSLSCSDYLALPAVGMEVKNRLQNDNISLSLPSQRVDRFDENIAKIIGGTKQNGLTFAPEAGTQRLRDIINKGLSNAELLKGIKTAFEQGWDKIKLYFMIGLPGETDADIIGIAETVRWLQQECRAPGRKHIRFNLTISNFTPKPHTPFQWYSVSSTEFRRKQALLRAELSSIKGVKANFTDVRISAMEDFLGRGNRSLGKVIRRAWELGAGMDAWFDNLDRAFTAWEQAIAEAGLTWKYAQGKNSAGKLIPIPRKQEQVTEQESVNLDQPLPWDHIDTGIEKSWLKADWQKSLAAAIVPDCSFAGCSQCGICGPEFGHNIVIEPPPIPQFAGHFSPKQEGKQRIRIWFGKLGDLALVSHLDLARLFDRAVRRANLPIAFTGGFHPSPRIAIANALPLGTTSTGEIVDMELTKSLPVDHFRDQLAANLPINIPIYRVEEIDLKAPSASGRLKRAEYFLSVAMIDTEENQETSQHWADVPGKFASWVQDILAKDTFWWEYTDKSGQIKKVNLRDRLFELERLESPPAILNLSASDPLTVLRYISTYQHDGIQLRPEHITYMLTQVAKQEFRLGQVHRVQLIM